jgi:hypothetical protein
MNQHHIVYKIYKVLQNGLIYPNVAKVGGLQSQDAKDEAVPTPGLRALGNVGSGVLRPSRRVKRIEKMT